MRGRRRIVLHPGFPKTGTSTIQHTLHANREFLLAEQKTLYPFMTVNSNGPLGTIFRKEPHKQMGNRMAGLTNEEVEKRRIDYLDFLNSEVCSHEWDTLLLSAEVIINLSEAEIAKLREWGEEHSSKWTILLCVRHPVDWTRSVIQQMVRQGDSLADTYERPPLPMYRKRISPLISVFGRENVRVFDFDTAVRSKGSVVGEFARQAQLPWEYLASRTTRTNESLSLEAVRILDSLNRQRPMFVDDVRASGRAGPEQEFAYLRRMGGREFDVPAPVKEDIRLQSREDVVWLNETFDLDLYRDIIDFAPRTEDHKEPVEALDDSVVDGIAEIFGELVTETAFHRILNGVRGALRRDDLERAEKMLREAARLNPDAPQPKSLLRQVAAKQMDRRRE